MVLTKWLIYVRSFELKKKILSKIICWLLKLKKTVIFATETPVYQFVFVPVFEMTITENIEYQVYNFFVHQKLNVLVFFIATQKSGQKYVLHG